MFPRRLLLFPFQSTSPRFFASSSSKSPATPVASSFTTVCAAQKKQKNETIPPMSRSLDELPTAVYAKKPKSDTFATEITQLPNGLTVASESHFGEYCTIGVAINTGCRFEAAYPTGICHFLEKLAFNSSLNRNQESIYDVLAKQRGLIDCQSTRDTFVYASSCHISGMDQVMSIIADAVWRPKITEEEFERARITVEFDIEDMNNRPDCEPLLTEWIHQAAFRGNTLGLGKFCTDPHKISREMLFSFMQTHFIPERIVVAGVGVSHSEIVESVRKYFDPSTTSWRCDASILLPNTPQIDASIAQYTGGEIKKPRDLSSMSLGPTPYPNLCHFVLGLEGASFKDEDFVAVCVLNTLMGGGGSFSAGGPGKGMYTKLYLDVLNKYHWMYNATAFNHAYADSGLFCIQSSTHPSMIANAAQVILQQILDLSAQAIGREQLERAKTQIQSQLMMNLETRPVVFEDVARQVLGHNERRTPQFYVEKITRITEKDIRRVVDRMLCSPAAIVGYGDLSRLPDYENVERAIAKRDAKLLNAGGKSFWSF